MTALFITHTICPYTVEWYLPFANLRCSSVPRPPPVRASHTWSTASRRGMLTAFETQSSSRYCSSRFCSQSKSAIYIFLCSPSAARLLMARPRPLGSVCHAAYHVVADRSTRLPVGSAQLGTSPERLVEVSERTNIGSCQCHAGGRQKLECRRGNLRYIQWVYM